EMTHTSATPSRRTSSSAMRAVIAVFDGASVSSRSKATRRTLFTASSVPFAGPGSSRAQTDVRFVLHFCYFSVAFLFDFCENRVVQITIEIPDVEGLRSLPDSSVLGLQTRLAAARRQIDAASARVAGEIARRSSVEAGHDGLAQRVGARTPQKLVAALT